jgi:hypothetical protein
MVAGIPGAGIGGLFYLASAFLMPLRALRKTWRADRDGRVAEARRQLFMAAAILAAIWITGWVLGLVLTTTGVVTAQTSAGALRYLPGASHNVIRVAVLFGGFATLGAVLLTVEIARVIVRRKGQTVVSSSSPIR